MKDKLIYFLIPIWTIWTIWTIWYVHYLYSVVDYLAILLGLIMLVVLSFFSYNISTIKKRVPLRIQKIFKNKFLIFLFYLILIYFCLFHSSNSLHVMLIISNFGTLFYISLSILILLKS